jgi:hypothetical protein
MAHPPVGLPLPCKGAVLWAAPQLVLLYEVNAQDEGLIEVGDEVLMLEKRDSYSDSELKTTQGLATVFEL